MDVRKIMDRFLDTGPSIPRALPLIFWVLAIAAAGIWARFQGPHLGWDIHIYGDALHSLRLEHDPYLDAILTQHAFDARQVDLLTDPKPLRYIYSPVTLPLLRLIGKMPILLSITLYGVTYIGSIFAAIWVAMLCVGRSERSIFVLLAPAAVFFPGLLQDETLMSGNIAYIVYGVAFLAAATAWRGGRWRIFYLAVVAASCFKLPFLTLLAIPILTARRQWIPAGITAAAALGLFALQPLLWPSTFHNFLDALDLQFTDNRDFGLSPAGLFAEALYDRIPYRTTGTLCYLAYGLPLASTLFYLSRRFLAGAISLRHWAPVVLVGTILLTPRIMEYDVAAITLPLALIAWRFLSRIQLRAAHRRTGLWMALFFSGVNAAAPFAWKLTEGCVLPLIFLAGIWTVWRDSLDREVDPDSVVHSSRAMESISVG